MTSLLFNGYRRVINCISTRVITLARIRYVIYNVRVNNAFFIEKAIQSHLKGDTINRIILV